MDALSSSVANPATMGIGSDYSQLRASGPSFQLPHIILHNSHAKMHKVATPEPKLQRLGCHTDTAMREIKEILATVLTWVPKWVECSDRMVLPPP